MSTLLPFYHRAYRWHRDAPARRFCNEARVEVYQRQLARFGGDTVMRHIGQTRAVLNRAEDKARLAASRERNRERRSD